MKDYYEDNESMYGCTPLQPEARFPCLSLQRVMQTQKKSKGWKMHISAAPQNRIELKPGS